MNVMKKMTPLIFLFLAPLFLSAQEQENTLEDQFVQVIDKSNRYEDYKVVKIYKLNNLRKSVLDSVAGLEQQVANVQTQLAQEKQRTDQLTSELDTTRNNLATSQQKEDGITLFGSLIKKSTYKMTMWGIIGFLLLSLAILFFRFKRSHAVTRDARIKLAETEEEFESHRQRTLEKEQQLRRKLQDEINKNRKVT